MVPSKHDQLILQLLQTGMIEVSQIEIEGDPLRPVTLILVRNKRHSHIARAPVLEPNIAGHPRFRVSVNGANGRTKRVWLSPARVVWIAYNRPTINNIGRIDGNPWNFNLWNLVERDTNDQNVTGMLPKTDPERDCTEPFSWDRDLPF